MKKTIILASALAITTTAFADDKKPEPKKEEPKKEAKKEEPKKEEPKKVDGAKMEAPKPAAEFTAAAKDMVGNWSCTGKMVMDPSKPAIEFKGSNKMSLDLDKFWAKGEYSLTAKEMKGAMKGTEYITYDAAQKKWVRIALDNTGGSEVATSSDMKSWEGEMRMMGMTMKVKTKVESSAKEMKVSSDMSMDGKKWITGAFEMTCKK